ncbi:MAG: hypothetical protein AAGA73_20080 [Pseudomonadota bacterium]
MLKSTRYPLRLFSPQGTLPYYRHAPPHLAQVGGVTDVALHFAFELLFGIMTSAVIGATLFDAADAICKRRNITQKHFSVFEIERLLRQKSQLRAKFFAS